MPLEPFKLVHIVAVILMIALTFSAFADPSSRRKKKLMILSGIASLLVVLTGFAMGHVWGWPVWFFGKLIIWVAISAFAGVVFRRKALAGPLGIITAILVFLATWLVVYKPF